MEKIILNLLIFTVLTPLAGQSGRYSDFIAKYSELACEIEQCYGVPAELTLCQAIFESDAGCSNLAEHQNNLFGIQTGDNWPHDSNNGFRCYESTEESFHDYGRFMAHYYPNAVGRRAEHWLRWCRGYGEPGYWAKIRKLYNQLWYI